MNTGKNKNSKFTLEVCPKLLSIWSIFKKKPKKNFFKVCLMDTLNLCLKLPKKMQKTKDDSDKSRLRKFPKTAKKNAKLEFGHILDVFSVWDDQIDF